MEWVGCERERGKEFGGEVKREAGSERERKLGR